MPTLVIATVYYGYSVTILKELITTLKELITTGLLGRGRLLDDDCHIFFFSRRFGHQEEE